MAPNRLQQAELAKANHRGLRAENESFSDDRGHEPGGWEAAD